MTFNVIIGAVVVALAALGVVWTLFQAVYAHASKKWPRTPGSIVTSSLSVDNDGYGRMYIADIFYRYVVDGHEYICDRVRFGGYSGFSWRRTGDAVTKRFPVGAAVTVAYDPAKPSRGVLEPGEAGQAYFKILLFAVMAVIGLAMAGAWA